MFDDTSAVSYGEMMSWRLVRCRRVVRGSVGATVIGRAAGIRQKDRCGSSSKSSTALEKEGFKYYATIHMKTLLTVLDELCSYGKEALFEALRSSHSLKNARLACRALRDAVDGNVEDINMRVGWLGFGPSASCPLWRWPRLTDLRLSVASPIDESEPLTLLTVPFEGQPSECLRRLKHLTVVSDDSRYTSLQAILALSVVLLRLGSLCSVTLEIPNVDAHEQQLLYDALESLTQLEELTLIGNFPLLLSPRAGALERRLRYLGVFPVTPEEDDEEQGDGPSPGSVDFGGLGLSWINSTSSLLRSLETVELEIQGVDTNAAQLQNLLSRPPPRLSRLSLKIYHAGGGISMWVISFEAGRVVSFHHACASDLQCLAEVAQLVVLPIDLTLPSFTINVLALHGTYDRGQEEEQLHDLRRLALWCKDFTVEYIHPPARDPLDQTLRVVRELGLPQGLLLNGGVIDLGHTSSEPTAGADQSAPAGGCCRQRWAALQADRDWAAVGGPEMLDLVAELALQRLDAAPPPADTLRGAADETGVGAAAAGRAGWRTVPSAETATSMLVERESTFLVRLQAPFLAAIAQAPAALREWMLWLSGKAPAKAQDRRGDADGARGLYIQAFLPQLRAQTVLVECRTAEHAAAVEMAARELLDAVQVYNAPRLDLKRLLHQAAQAFWDSGAGGSKEQRLTLLLKYHEALMERSPVIRL